MDMNLIMAIVAVVLMVAEVSDRRISSICIYVDAICARIEYRALRTLWKSKHVPNTKNISILRLDVSKFIACTF